MSSVVVIDYGMGNLHSIAKALQHVASDMTVCVSADAQTILQADRVVFPGVGAMRDCMQALHDSGLAEVILEVAKS
jgi:glutamine amidotransferase